MTDKQHNFIGISPDSPVCCDKGLIYKYYESSYIDKRGGWNCSQKMVFQKRMSCDCQDLGITETLHEFPEAAEFPVSPDKGCYYELVINSAEPHYIDDGDVDYWAVFIKINPEVK